MELIDTHCHLVDRAYAADRDEVIARAWDAGLVGLVCVGYDLKSSRAALRLAERDDRIRVAVGVHPHYAAEIAPVGEGGRASGRQDFTAELRELAGHPRVVAIGETGLDFYRDLSPRPAQSAVFRKHIALALELGLPLIVHDRDAHDETLAILRESYPGGRCGPGGLMHCFSGDAVMAKACLDLGFHVSFAGPLTYPKADQARRAAQSVPPDRLLVETDCPYLSPQSCRGRRNEPACVAEVVAGLARARGDTPEETARLTTDNARRLFRIG